jgi:VWFA-related protein
VVAVPLTNVQDADEDRNGLRVHGLPADAFSLEVDGRETPIDFFAEVRGGSLVEATTDRVTAPLSGIAAGEPVPTSYLIYVDDYFALANDRDRVLDELASSLEHLRPEDRVAVVAFDGDRLTMLTSWTSNHSEIVDALDRARQRRAHGLARLAELRRNDDQLRDYWRTTFRPYRFALRGLERDFAERLASQLERSVVAASSTLRGFGDPPGRKVMLLLAGGWPFSPGEYTVGTYFARFQDAVAGSLDTTIGGRAGLFEPLADTANLLGYTLYTVDVPGLSPFDQVDVTQSSPRPVSRLASFDREDQTEHSLRFLAAETGGEPLINGRRTTALRHVAQDPRSDYWLGFSADRSEDGRRHDLEVQVTTPGLAVRAREGYVDLTRSQELDLMVQSALQFGNPPSDQPLELVLGERSERPGRKQTLPLEIGVPMAQIYLLDNAGRHRARLELRIQAAGPDGGLSDVARQTIAIDEADAPAADAVFWHSTQLVVRPDTERLVVAVYDPVSGSILSRIARLGGDAAG